MTELVPFINWSYFFAAWHVSGRFPEIFNHPEKGAQAKELYDDAQTLLNKIINENLLHVHAVAGIFPACSDEDDIVIYNNEFRKEIITRLPQLRNQQALAGEPNLCLADFLLPTTAAQADKLGLFALTSGIGLNELIRTYKAAHDDYNAIMAKALADRLAEACAEWLHRKLFREYAVISENNPDKLTGIRPAVGYPSCPDHSMKRDIFGLLNAEKEIGITLTESYMMLPETSVCGFIFFRPQARYFSVGKIDARQLADYSARRGMRTGELKRLMPENVLA